MAHPNDNGTTKSTKFAAAVQRATGNELAVNAPMNEIAAPTIPPGFEGMVGTFTPAFLAGRLSSGELEWAPRVIKLEEGMFIKAILEGRGGFVDLEQVDRVAKTVELKQVGTWIIRDPRSGMRGSFLTAAQLEDKLPPFVGGTVEIYVGKMLESSKGHRYRDFLVGGEPLADGKTRTWAKALPAPVIDLVETAAASEDLIEAQAS